MKTKQQKAEVSNVLGEVSALLNQTDLEERKRIVKALIGLYLQDATTQVVVTDLR